MASRKDDPPALSSPAPAFRGPQTLAALIPRAARPAFRRRSAAAAQILADWPIILGPELAAMAEPVKLVRGTLTLGCTGPAAMELSLLGPVLVERINGHLGRAAVERLAFVQRAPRPAPPAPRALPPPAPLPPATAARLDALPEGELRDALSKLARGVYRNPR
ncbi:MAG: DUF721 domain-containing protein [Rubritepida sp.]|nr:DUF721 domain-containing protein [Rubritepida sp.]